MKERIGGIFLNMLLTAMVFSSSFAATVTHIFDNLNRLTKEAYA
ncbi:MAG: hypothetical protein AB1585_06400 [Thermodesulfobacteriota bacterium]